MPTHQLSAFDPLERILYYDDFDRGMQGWSLLTGNYENTLDSVLPEQRDFRPPMLSNLTMWDTGTAGSLHGSYAMKLATRAQTGSIAAALKRTTYRSLEPVQVEVFFTAKPEASELKLSVDDLRAFGIFLDLQDGSERVMPHLRYENATHGTHRGQWTTKETQTAVTTLSHETRTHFHLGPDNWNDLPDGQQALCYNELPTKQNWHYLKVIFDLRTMQFLKFQCNDHVFQVADINPLKFPAWPNLDGMLNVGFWVEADTDKRSFLYIDSVLLSTGEVR